VLELDHADIPAYLRARGLLGEGENATVTPLGGGVSNIVVRVITPRMDAVLKQALARLRVKDDWPSRIDRVFREKDCLETLFTLLDGRHVPRVLFEDRDNYLFGMSHAPAGAQVWKAQLMGGQIDHAVARQVGAILGLIHGRSQGDPDVAARFAGQEVFDQLRIDPYYRTTAARHPDLAPLIDAQVARMGRTRTALVHGDYSPKNLLVLPDGEVWVLDCEVAHWGDPTFDLAFCLNHLFLKEIHNPAWAAAYARAREAFWARYLATVGEQPACLERDTVAQLGCVMLARIDGKSPVEYIVAEAEKDLVRRVSGRILREGPGTLAAVEEIVAAESATARGEG
jgi:5-methylthioribose kinase